MAARMGKLNNPNAKKNLRPPWKPGESGNPAGNPVGTISITAALRAMLDHDTKTDNPVTGEKNVKMKVSQRLALSIIARAIMKGGDKAAEMILERMEGKLAQPLKHTGIPAPTSPASAELTNVLAGLTPAKLERLLTQLEKKKPVTGDET